MIIHPNHHFWWSKSSESAIHHGGDLQSGRHLCRLQLRNWARHGWNGWCSPKREERSRIFHGLLWVATLNINLFDGWWLFCFCWGRLYTWLSLAASPPCNLAGCHGQLATHSDFFGISWPIDHPLTWRSSEHSWLLMAKDGGWSYQMAALANGKTIRNSDPRVSTVI